jgi:metallophosphoesterase (TIGR00282 family)
MRVLILGQIVGKAGLQLTKNVLPTLKTELGIEFTIAVADAVTGGFGLGKNHAFYLRKMGVNALIGGEALFFKKDIIPEFSSFSFILRPANFGSQSLGYGSNSFTVGEHKLGVLNLQGQSGSYRSLSNNPFTSSLPLLNRLSTGYTITTFCSPTTAEKQTLGHYLAGKTNAVIGYGGKALTADARIINGTAFITDCGRIGTSHSVGGFIPKGEIERLTLQRPTRSIEATEGACELQGVVLTLKDDNTATHIEPLRRHYIDFNGTAITSL